MYGLNSVFPLIDYINKLVSSGKLPQTLMAQYDQNESYDLSENKEVKDMIKHYEDMLKSLERKKKIILVGILIRW